MSDRTLVLLKPDAVERKLVGSIVSRIEAKNLDVVAMELRQLDTDTLARHYEEHVGKGFYDDLVTFMSRGPVVAMVIEGPEDTPYSGLTCRSSKSCVIRTLFRCRSTLQIS